MPIDYTYLTDSVKADVLERQLGQLNERYKRLHAEYDKIDVQLDKAIKLLRDATSSRHAGFVDEDTWYAIKDYLATYDKETDK